MPNKPRACAITSSSIVNADRLAANSHGRQTRPRIRRRSIGPGLHHCARDTAPRIHGDTGGRLPADGAGKADTRLPADRGRRRASPLCGSRDRGAEERIRRSCRPERGPFESFIRTYLDAKATLARSTPTPPLTTSAFCCRRLTGSRRRLRQGCDHDRRVAQSIGGKQSRLFFILHAASALAVSLASFRS